MKGLRHKIGLLVLVVLLGTSGNLFAGEREIRGKVVGYNGVDGVLVLRVGVYGIAGEAERDLTFDVSGAKWTVCLGGSCSDREGKAGFGELGFYRTFEAYGMEPGKWTAILKAEDRKVSAVRINIR